MDDFIGIDPGKCLWQVFAEYQYDRRDDHRIDKQQPSRIDQINEKRIEQPGHQRRQDHKGDVITDEQRTQKVPGFIVKPAQYPS